MKEIYEILKLHFELYPNMQIQDCVKLLYQSYFGSGHLIKGEKALQYIENERNYIDITEQSKGGFIVPLVNGFCRVSLREYCNQSLDIEKLSIAFLRSNIENPDILCMTNALHYLLELIKTGIFPLDYNSSHQFIEKYISLGLPMISHTQIFRDNYSPAYRIVKCELLPYLFNNNIKIN